MPLAVVRSLGALNVPTTGTTVHAADGSTFEIPGGVPGSYPWVRQASLLAATFHQGGDDNSAYAWNREYDKRRLIWDAAQSGADLQAVIDAASIDLVAPFEILFDAITGLIKGIGRVGGALIDTVVWLPWLLAGGLVVAGIGLYRGSLRIRH
jgi:hypothetical protein